MKLFLAFLVAAAGCGGDGSGGGPGACTTLGTVCLLPPTTSATRTACGDVTEYCDPAGSSAPHLDCLAMPIVNPPGPAKVRLTGFVHVFSSGPDSGGVQVMVYDAQALAGGADPSMVTPLGTTTAELNPLTQRACDKLAQFGCSLPSATGCALPKCNDGLQHAGEAAPRSDDGKYCRDDGGGNTVCADRLRWEGRYTIDNVPTNRQLVIKTAGAGGNPDQNWSALVAWNVYLSTHDAACTSVSSTDCLDVSSPALPLYQLNVNALSKSDYANIPQTAGLSSGISPGQGAVAGEVHDCDNVRVGNVAVGTTPQSERFTYFNGNPIMTLPDPSRFTAGTDKLGLFAALNLKPGLVSVQAGGLLSAGAALTSFGAFPVRIYPDTVSVVNINGGRPPQ